MVANNAELYELFRLDVKAVFVPLAEIFIQ